MELITNNEFKNTMGIYKITNNETGKVYIGSSTQIKTRINNHIKNLDENKHHNKILQKDFNIYGNSKFSWSLVEVVEEKSKLPYREKYHIDEYTKINGVYNISDPTEEFWQNRSETEIIKNKLIDKEQRKKINKSYIFGWMDCKFAGDLNKIKNKINEKMYIEKDKIDRYIHNNFNINEVELSVDYLNEWYNSNGIFILQMPYYKKEFREIYDIVFDREMAILVNESTCKSILKRRTDNIIEIKSVRREKTINKTPTVTKKTKEKKSLNGKLDRPSKEKIKDIFETEFEYLFEKMEEKLVKRESVSFNKVSDFLFEKINNTMNVDIDSFNNLLRNYLRKSINASIFTFSSDMYFNETLEKFNIEDREVRIISKELGKEISDYNRLINETLFLKKEDI